MGIEVQLFVRHRDGETSAGLYVPWGVSMARVVDALKSTELPQGMIMHVAAFDFDAVEACPIGDSEITPEEADTLLKRMRSVVEGLSSP